MSGAIHYAIRGVWDFAKVPDERLDECLKEFAVAVRVSRAALELIDAVSDELGGPSGLVRMTDTFLWIDDGKREAHLNILPSPAESV